MSLPEDARRKPSRATVERLSDGFGERTRLMPQVEVLERRGALTARQAEAGAAIYTAWAIGIMGARDADTGGNSSDHDGFTVAQMDSARRYRQIRQALGPRLWPLTFAVTIEDWSPYRWANERGQGMHKAAALELLRLALDLAADCLG